MHVSHCYSINIKHSNGQDYFERGFWATMHDAKNHAYSLGFEIDRLIIWEEYIVSHSVYDSETEDRKAFAEQVQFNNNLYEQKMREAGM